MTALMRGQVVRADIGLAEPKLFVVVSNNNRNRALPSVLAVRLTTSAKPVMPSIVELHREPGLTGLVVCDDVTEIFDDEVIGVLGSVAPGTMAEVEAGLRAALGMR